MTRKDRALAETNSLVGAAKKGRSLVRNQPGNEDSSNHSGSRTRLLQHFDEPSAPVLRSDNPVHTKIPFGRAGGVDVAQPTPIKQRQSLLGVVVPDRKVLPRVALQRVYLYGGASGMDTGVRAEEHLHSGINLVTLTSRHYGEDQALQPQRETVYEKTKRLHPRRWSGKTRNWAAAVDVSLNPEDRQETERNQVGT